MAGGHLEDIGIVEEAAPIVQLVNLVACAARQRLPIGHRPAAVACAEIDRLLADLFLLHRRAVDVKNTLQDLDFIARQTDHPLDVIGGIILRQLEDGDVAPFGFRAKDPSGNRHGAERERVSGIAVAVFRDEEIIPDQQGRDQRSCRDVEGLEEERPNHKRYQQRLDDNLDGFPQAFLLLFGLAVQGRCLPGGPRMVRLDIATGAGRSNGGRGFTTQRAAPRSPRRPGRRGDRR